MKHQVSITEQREEDTAAILKLDCSFLILSWPHVMSRYLRFCRKLCMKGAYLNTSTWVCVKHIASILGFLCNEVQQGSALVKGFFQISLLLTLYYENTDEFRVS